MIDFIFKLFLFETMPLMPLKSTILKLFSNLFGSMKNNALNLQQN